MSLLTANDIVRIKADQALAFPQTGTIKRLSTSTDSLGVVTESFSTVSTSYCRLAPMNGREAELAAKLTELAAYTIIFPAGTDVRVGDQVLISTRTFRVLSAAAGNVDLTWEMAKRVICEEVKA